MAIALSFFIRWRFPRGTSIFFSAVLALGLAGCATHQSRIEKPRLMLKSTTKRLPSSVGSRPSPTAINF